MLDHYFIILLILQSLVDQINNLKLHKSEHDHKQILVLTVVQQHK